MSGIMGGETLAIVAGEGEGIRVAPPAYPGPRSLNGAAVRIPVKTHRIELSDGYEGMYALLRMNPPRSTIADFNSGDFERMCAAMAQLVTAWNVAGDDGQVLPISVETVREVPDDLLRQLVQGFLTEFNARATLPKGSPAPSETTQTTPASQPESAAGA